MISRSSRASMRPRTCNPVVPASPSMKIFFLASSTVRNKGRLVCVGAKAAEAPVLNRSRRAEFKKFMVKMLFDFVTKSGDGCGRSC